MNVGKVIYARTHAELLNQLLNKHYKAYMKSSIKLPDGKLLWMIELGNFETPSHWINQFNCLGEISERHVGNSYEYEGHGTYFDSKMRNIYWDDSDRVVFEKVQVSPCERKYIFRGVFRLNKNKCTLDENIWEQYSDQWPIE